MTKQPKLLYIEFPFVDLENFNDKIFLQLLNVRKTKFDYVINE